MDTGPSLTICGQTLAIVFAFVFGTTGASWPLFKVVQHSDSVAEAIDKINLFSTSAFTFLFSQEREDQRKEKQKFTVLVATPPITYSPFVLQA